MTSRRGDAASLDPVAFIRERTRLAPVRGVPEVRLHMAHEATGLWRLTAIANREAPPPYWAFPWAGGLALARHLLDHPAVVAGRRVFDLGSGSGLVAIAALKAGAAEATAAEVDPFGVAAIGLNATANEVAVRVVSADVTGGAAPEADVVTVGDLFYDALLAARVTAFLDRSLAGGAVVLVGDPGRAYLPRERLRLVAEYATSDVGEVENAPLKTTGVFAFQSKS